MEKMLKFKEYAKQYKDGGLTIFDIDDTLFHTTAKILIKKKGKVIHSLSTSEFNSYQLKPGETEDFSEFADADKFYKESTPIKKMFAKAKAIVKNAEAHPNSKVVIVTARDDFNNRDRFLDTFRKYGFDIDKVRVERAGKISGQFIPAFKKAIIIKNYLDTKQFSKVRLFDDSINNLKEFLKLQHMFPMVKFEAFHAHPDGTVNKVR
jgi:hypothetical protein